jgi:YD repeat-containing protein
VEAGPLSQTTRYQYDPLDHVTQIADPVSGVTKFEYDPNENLLTVTDAVQNQMPVPKKMVYTYENMDRLQTRTDQLGNLETYDYDPAGNLQHFTDRRGKVENFGYDALNRRTFAGFGTSDCTPSTCESTIGYSYDGLDRLTQATDSLGGNVTRSYDDPRGSDLNRSSCYFNSRGPSPVCVLLFVLLLPGSVYSQTAASISRLDARIVVQKNTDLAGDKTVEIVTPDSRSSVVATFTRAAGNQEGQSWTVTNRVTSLFVDGSVRDFKTEDVEGEIRLTVLEAGTYAPGRHVLRIVYTVSSAFTADGDRWISPRGDNLPGHQYALRMQPLLTFGMLSAGETRVANLPVEAARIDITVPSDVPLNDVVFQAHTGGPGTAYGPSRCDCMIDLSPPEHRITINTTKTIEANNYLSIVMYFRPSSLSPDRAERRRLYAQAHPDLIGFGQWVAVLLLYIIPAAGLAACTRWSPRWRSHERLVLLFLAVLAVVAGVASVWAAGRRLDLVHLGRPGIDAGIWLSMIIFPGAHGPEKGFLIVPTAFVFQVLFYFGVGWVVFRMIRGHPVGKETKTQA